MTPAVSESDIQIAIVEYLSIVAKRYGLLFFSVPNEAMTPKDGKRLSGPEYGRMAKLKKMGLRSGVADLVIVRKAYFMEVKKPGGKQSVAQKEFMSDALAVGSEYAVVRSVDDAIKALEAWGIKK
jgi:hypothetical protein